MPSSLTSIRVLPPFSSATRTWRAPASSAFSTSSFTTERRALDHLAGGDLIGDGVGQNGDVPRHGENLAADRGYRRVRQPALPTAGGLHEDPPWHPSDDADRGALLNRRERGSAAVRRHAQGGVV